MSARDIYHGPVVNALIKDGWTITHDPYKIPIGVDKVYVDLGAEQPVAAEKAGQRIAIEIKSFLGPSDIYDLERALGQYVFYRSLMSRHDRDRKLFLAVPDTNYEATFRRPIAEIPVADLKVSIVVFDPDIEEILRWIP